METKNKIWVSVDGGGTKTMFCAGDASGNSLYTGTSGGSNYKSTGMEMTVRSFKEGFTAMLKSLNRTWEDIAGVVMAIAGCDTRQDLWVYRKLMSDLPISPEKVFICNDTESIFRAVTEKNGICVVAGTGSIVCAYDSNGLAGRTGGWGPNVSDLGSGYWIGTEVIRKMICWLDGIETQEHPVYHEIAERFQEKDTELAWTLAGLTVFETASVSLQVFNYAEDGDSYCRVLIEKAADWIIRQITALCRKMDYREDFPIVTVGGLFNNKTFSERVQERVRRELTAAKPEFIRPVNSPAEDGLRYARRLFPMQR